MPRRPLVDRIHRGLLRLLPRDFRGDFGDDMRADFDARRVDEGDARAIRREAGPLLSTAIREHAGILRRDVRDALRTMRRAPGFTALALLMLALGTGVNVAMFSIIDAVMLRSPFVDRERIATVLVASPSESGGPTWSAAVPLATFEELRVSPVIDAVTGMGSGRHLLTGPGEPRRADFDCVTAAMFRVLGTPPQYGRVFTAADDRPGAAPTIVLSDRFARQIGDPPALVGTTIAVNRTPVTIVGIMPRSFGGPYSSTRTEGWLPLQVSLVSGDYAGCRGLSQNVMAFARVRGDLTLTEAERALPGIRLLSSAEQTYGDHRTALLVLAAAVVCVLLIACLNVGGLQLERALARRRELAVRVALGASRARLVRHALTENLVLALTGATVAVVATWLSIDAIVSILLGNLVYRDEITINTRAVAAAIGVAAAAALVAGLIPALFVRNAAPAVDLGASNRGATSRGGATRSLFVVVEITLSVVVLIAAGLMIRTFATLRPSQPGFDPRGTLTTRITLEGAAKEAPERLFRRLFDRLGEIPGVRGVEGTTYLPLSGTTTRVVLAHDGREYRVNAPLVTPGYFDLMSIPIVAGRGFTPADSDAGPRVAVVNEALAARLAPGGNAVGLRVRAQWPREPARDVEIVGVIGNTRSMRSTLTAWEEFTAPYAQRPQPFLNAMIRSDRARDPELAGEIRTAIRAVLPDLPQEPLRNYAAEVDDAAATPRFGAWLLGVFAALAVTLSAIGLMTTMGWWVRQRTRELGVRVALGASRSQILRLVLRQGVAIGVTGIAAGAIAAAGVTRYLKGWIYGVTPLDPATFASAIAMMAVVALIAVYVPVRRALRVDPIVALRAE